MEWTEEEIHQYLQLTYVGFYHTRHLPLDVYEKLGAYLAKGVKTGYGPDTASTMLNDLKTNVYIFSGAKTYQQTRDIMAKMIDPATGTRTPEAEFMKQARQVFDEYNVNWLKTEYKTAVGQAQNASHWETFQRNKKRLKKLQYVTVGDGRVRHEHAVLDGIIRPVDDPFWAKYMPQNDWNCRCTVYQIEEGDDTDLSKIALPVLPEDFSFNPGIERQIFSPEHPYFKVEKRDVEFAKTNFGLPIPKPEAMGAKTIKEAKEASKKLVEGLGFEVETVSASKKMTIERFNAYNNQLRSLVDEYEVADVWDFTRKPKLKFQSGSGFYGKIRRSLDGKELVEINFGDSVDKYGRLFDENSTSARSKSRVDPANVDIATLTHEFAHVISIRQHEGLGVEKVSGFWKKLNGLRSEYTTKVQEMQNNPKLVWKDFQHFYLGEYSATNASEFMAEAFTEYKLSSNPSEYAKKVGELIDKTFKKSNP